MRKSTTRVHVSGCAGGIAKGAAPMAVMRHCPIRPVKDRGRGASACTGLYYLPLHHSAGCRFVVFNHRGRALLWVRAIGRCWESLRGLCLPTSLTFPRPYGPLIRESTPPLSSRYERRRAPVRVQRESAGASYVRPGGTCLTCSPYVRPDSGGC